MFCKWCGLESDTTDVCSWCRRPFSTAAKPPEETSAGEASRTQEAVGEPPRPAEPPVPVVPARAPASAPPAVAETPAPAAPPPLVRDDIAPSPFGDEIDDDFNPTPFAAPATVAQAPPPRRPPFEVQTQAEPRAQVPQQSPAPASPEPRQRPTIETIPIRKAAAPPGVIPVARQPVAPPLDAEQTAPPPGERPPHAPPPPIDAGPSVVPIRPASPVTPLAETHVPEPDLPELDLTPLTDEASDFVAPAGNRLDLDDAPVIELPVAPPRPTPGPLPAFARPIPETTVHVPKAGGRTWYCRWCGMESETGDRCSWCKKDLRNLPAAGTGKGPVLAASKRTVVRAPTPVRRGRDGNSSKPAPPEPAPARTREPAVPKMTPPPVAAPASGGAAVAAARQGVPVLGTFQAQKSKYYADQVVDPVSGRHYDADSGETTDTPVTMVEDLVLDERRDRIRQSSIYLAGLAVAILICVAAARVLPDWYLALIAALNIAAGMAMPPLRVVDYGEDDSSDVQWAIPLILVLGPIVGGMAYGVIAIMRQDANPAIVGIFITYLLIRFPLQWAASVSVGDSLQSLVPFSPPPDGKWGVHLALQWLPFATMAGWYMAAVFHKTDE